jgi:hypothetical protein
VQCFQVLYHFEQVANLFQVLKRANQSNHEQGGFAVFEDNEPFTMLPLKSKMALLP